MTHQIPHRTCGTMDVHLRLLRKSEDYVRERERIENLLAEYNRRENRIRKSRQS